jgi:DNA repair exonuclease SbcCD ATPase subunit
MDRDSNVSKENLVRAIQVVRQNQKAQVMKMSELEKKFEVFDKLNERLCKLENVYSDNCEHVEGITVLEEKFRQVTEKLSDIEGSIHKIDEEIRMLEETNSSKALEEIEKIDISKRRDKNLQQKNSFPCEMCDKIFDASFYLEVHMKEHNCAKKFRCDICDRHFYVEWRLKRHIKGHNDVNQKICNFFNSGKHCPYD